MEDFLKILGGTGLVLGALFAFLGKIAIGRLLEKERSKTESSLSKLRIDLEKSVHIGKAQFDFEFKIYQEIWKKLVLLRSATLGLRPALDHIDPNESDEERKSRRMKEFSDAFHPFRDSIEENKPFYPESVYLALSEVLSTSHKELISFNYQKRDSMKYWDEAVKNQKEIVSLIDIACESLRQRFENVKVV